MTRRVIEIQDWRLEDDGRLTGITKGHPRFTDGEFISTSVTISLDRVAGIAHTKNTTYKLGKERKKPNGETN